MDIKNHVEGNWKDLKGSLRKGLGKVTDNDWNKAEGSYDQLLGAVQKSYAIGKNEAEEMISKYIDHDTLQAAKSIGNKYLGEAEKLIKDHPVASIVIALIAGIWLGRK